MVWASSFSGIVGHVEAVNIAVWRDQTINISLSIQEGGDATSSLYEAIDLILEIRANNPTGNPKEEINLFLIVGSGPGTGLITGYPIQALGLKLDFMVGSGDWRILWDWIPTDPVKFVGANYTYRGTISLLGLEQEARLVIAFEGFPLTEKYSNSTGQFKFWAVVNSPGYHTWTITIYQDGVFKAAVYKDEFYEPEGPPGPEDPEDPIIDLPTEPGSLFMVLDFLPVMTVFGMFGFIGMLLVGRIGILFGGIAALAITTAMGTIPMWVTFFLILVTIIVVVFKLKGVGGSNVTVNGGNGA